MTSIITAVFKATIGLLVNKGRDAAAERLKDGDVTDQKFRGLIVREIDDVKSKLEGLARKDLLTSISYFRQGVVYLFQLLDKAEGGMNISVATQAGMETKRKGLEVNFQRPETTAASVSLAEDLRKTKLTELDGADGRALLNAKEGFKVASLKATEAFNNEALSSTDRIQALVVRVAATLLEKVDYPEDALAACRLCLEELHSMQVVQNSFAVDLKKGLRGLFSKDERRQIISAVCRVNRAIYDVFSMICGFGKDDESCVLFNWPAVDIGGEQVNPLLDSRVAKTLRKMAMQHLCVKWSFGQEGETNHKLEEPRGIATNADGQFIIGDDGDKTIKVFDSCGMFTLCFPLSNDAASELECVEDILDVATDANSNTFVLVILWKAGFQRLEWKIHIYSKNADPLLKFPVSKGDSRWGRLTVTNHSKVLVLVRNKGKDVVDVYEHDGRYVRTLGEGILKNAVDITAAPDGIVIIMDRADSCIYLFTEDGQQQSKFHIITEDCLYLRIDSHPTGEHVSVAGIDQGTFESLHLATYATDGKLKRNAKVDERVSRLNFRGVTVTMEGRIAVAVIDEQDKGKVIVF